MEGMEEKSSGVKGVMKAKLEKVMGGGPKSKGGHQDNCIDGVQCVDGKILARFSTNNDTGTEYKKPVQRAFDDFDQFAAEAKSFIGVPKQTKTSTQLPKSQASTGSYKSGMSMPM